MSAAYYVVDYLNMQKGDCVKKMFCNNNCGCRRCNSTVIFRESIGTGIPGPQGPQGPQGPVGPAAHQLSLAGK